MIMKLITQDSKFCYQQTLDEHIVNPIKIFIALNKNFGQFFKKIIDSNFLVFKSHVYWTTV